MTWNLEEDMVKIMCVQLDGENEVEWDHAWIVHISEI